MSGSHQPGCTSVDLGALQHLDTIARTLNERQLTNPKRALREPMPVDWLEPYCALWSELSSLTMHADTKEYPT